jgi:CubicO group peptidase (beta-lactamase class C family)
LSKEDLAYVDSMETTAFLVFKNDSLLFEKYFEGTDVETTSNSFSMAKSFTSILIGKAIDEGYIKSVDQKVGDFIPEYANGPDAQLTIKHLLQMTSGIPFGESYSSPFGYMARAYYGKDLKEETFAYHVEKEPGTFWIYEGGNTVLLGLILEKATGRTVSDYFFEKIWSCIGAEYNTYWNLDKRKGLAKTYTGVYATARDYARIGKLYMHDGVWDNDTVISPEFVRASLSPCNIPDSTGKPATWYGYQWWLGEHRGSPLFSARGMRGQYIVVLPEEKLMFVRIGHQQSKERVSNMPIDLFRYLDIAKQLAQ